MAIRGIGPAAVPELKQFLQGDDEKVQLQAADWLSVLGENGKDAIPVLITLLEEAKFNENRARAIETLSRFGPLASSAVPALKNALRHNDLYVRTGAARALAKVDGTAVEALPMLMESMRMNPDRDVAPTVDALRSLGKPAVDYLLQNLVQPNGEVGNEPSLALTKLAPVSAVPELIKLLQTGNNGAKQAAARILKAIGPPAKDAVPALTETARRSEPYDNFAIDALAAIGPASAPATSELCQLLTSPTMVKREAAANALRTIGPDARAIACEPLVKLCRDMTRDGSVGPRDARRAGASALVVMDPSKEDSYPILLEWLKDIGHLKLMESAPDFLSRGGAKALPFLRRALVSEKSGQFRNRIALVIVRIDPDDKDAWETLVSTLASPEFYYRDEVVKNLHHAGPAIVPALIQLLKKTDSRVREAAAQVITRIGPPASEAANVLVACLKDNQQKNRWHFARALGSLKGAAISAGPALVDGLRDSDPLTRYACAAALAEIDPANRQAIPVLIELRGHVPMEIKTNEGKESLIYVGPQELGYSLFKIDREEAVKNGFAGVQVKYRIGTYEFGTFD
ncbi:MAG: HEAT repeat domain-containing protein [Planctomycetes bacterium]|nr:HEAT repeat domain-containing protein [Planctomycetota bacterium]